MMTQFSAVLTPPAEEQTLAGVPPVPGSGPSWGGMARTGERKRIYSATPTSSTSEQMFTDIVIPIKWEGKAVYTKFTFVFSDVKVAKVPSSRVPGAKAPEYYTYVYWPQEGWINKVSSGSSEYPLCVTANLEGEWNKELSLKVYSPPMEEEREGDQKQYDSFFLGESLYSITTPITYDGDTTTTLVFKGDLQPAKPGKLQIAKDIFPTLRITTAKSPFESGSYTPTSKTLFLTEYKEGGITLPEGYYTFHFTLPAQPHYPPELRADYPYCKIYAGKTRSPGYGENLHCTLESFFQDAGLYAYYSLSDKAEIDYYAKDHVEMHTWVMQKGKVLFKEKSDKNANFPWHVPPTVWGTVEVQQLDMDEHPLIPPVLVNIPFSNAVSAALAYMVWGLFGILALRPERWRKAPVATLLLLALPLLTAWSMPSLVKKYFEMDTHGYPGNLFITFSTGIVLAMSIVSLFAHRCSGNRAWFSSPSLLFLSALILFSFHAVFCENGNRFTARFFFNLPYRFFQGGTNMFVIGFLFTLFSFSIFRCWRYLFRRLLPSDFLFPWVTCAILFALGFGILHALFHIGEWKDVFNRGNDWHPLGQGFNLSLWALIGVAFYLVVSLFFLIIRCSPYYRQPFEKYLPKLSAAEKTTQAAE